MDNTTIDIFDKISLGLKYLDNEKPIIIISFILLIITFVFLIKSFFEICYGSINGIFDNIKFLISTIVFSYFIETTKRFSELNLVNFFLKTIYYISISIFYFTIGIIKLLKFIFSKKVLFSFAVKNDPKWKIVKKQRFYIRNRRIIISIFITFISSSIYFTQDLLAKFFNFTKNIVCSIFYGNMFTLLLSYCIILLLIEILYNLLPKKIRRYKDYILVEEELKNINNMTI